MATVHQIQCPGHPEAARCSEETKCATVKRKEKRKGKLTYRHIYQMSVEMTETGHGAKSGFFCSISRAFFEAKCEPRLTSISEGWI